MSTLICEVCEVLDIQKHPNADKLELIKIKGWICVAQIGLYKIGEKVIYAPIDSVLPIELSDKMEITRLLARGRIKTIKLRGYYSQGLIISMRFLDEDLPIGSDVREKLGITKYEPPIEMTADSELEKNIPDEFYKYTKIENIKNYPDILQSGEKVIITEKIHGTNFRAMKFNGKLYVGGHKLCYEKNEKNIYWKAAIQADLENKLEEGYLIYGEVYGEKINNLRYELKNRIDIRFFDMAKNGKYLNYDQYKSYCKSHELQMVPELYLGDWKSLEDVNISTDKSSMASHMMEGFVITPVIERYDPLVGRVKLKYVSEKFLIKQYGDRH